MNATHKNVRVEIPHEHRQGAARVIEQRFRDQILHDVMHDLIRWDVDVRCARRSDRGDMQRAPSWRARNTRRPAS